MRKVFPISFSRSRVYDADYNKPNNSVIDKSSIDASDARNLFENGGMPKIGFDGFYLEDKNRIEIENPFETRKNHSAIDNSTTSTSEATPTEIDPTHKSIFSTPIYKNTKQKMRLKLSPLKRKNAFDIWNPMLYRKPDVHIHSAPKTTNSKKFPHIESLLTRKKNDIHVIRNKKEKEKEKVRQIWEKHQPPLKGANRSRIYTRDKKKVIVSKKCEQKRSRRRV